jgi:hypothetical protein
MPEQPLADVTAIRVVVNMTNGDVIVKNLEQPDGRDDMTIGPNTVGISHKDGTPMWIPWCFPDSTWNQKHITIRVNTDAVIYSIYQYGSYIRYSTDDKYYKEGHQVAGFSNIIGDRIVIIDKDFRLSFVKLT